ncbi:MAG: N-acetylmuramoyl-L-alanine amidase [Candidatus Omnitrophota bacterium]|nr:N-acetylmuramoyl-L-alanine amidase [Candidatus Omnitrophota bacterium]
MKRSLALITLALILSSCVRAPVKTVVAPLAVYPGQPPLPAQSVVIPPPAFSLRSDIVHSVAPGETIWRICKMYDVKMEDVTQANNIADPASIKMGQRLLIPQASAIRPVVNLYPSRKWRYIIIHHSATGEGNAFSFHKFHRFKGWDSLGYHFVVDNGTAGKKEGNIEASPRWIKQQNGAHCKDSEMNYKGIGICLVGNFNKEQVSQEQLDSLVYLVDLLRAYYRIPPANIIGHSQVPGARTDCPGKNFPWRQFQERLQGGGQ